ncbi:MAG: DUF4250 domain-containing protein [Mogibacterium sp.]|nr:DUF4250 domain-containing protein [Mogibacterium sp.]
MSITKDPNMLYSYINMMLRDDEYESLEDLCAAKDVPLDEIVRTLEAAGYSYDETIKQFR